MLPADQAPRQHEVQEPPRRSSDAGQELMRLTAERMAADHLEVDQAKRLVLRDDPILARHYAAGTPLPLGPRPSRGDELLKDLGVQLQKHRQELVELQQMFGPPARRHFSQLSPAEQRRALPERRLLPGDRLRPGEVQVEKMGTPVTGGGSYAVMEQGA